MPYSVRGDDVASETGEDSPQEIEICRATGDDIARREPGSQSTADQSEPGLGRQLERAIGLVRGIGVDADLLAELGIAPSTPLIGVVAAYGLLSAATLTASSDGVSLRRK